MSLTDANLSQLLNLGFDHELCIQALSQHNDVQQAIEWILTLQEENGTTTSNVEIPWNNTPFINTTTTSNDSYQDQQELERQRTASAKEALKLRQQRRLDQQARQRALNDIKEDRAYVNQIRPKSTISPSQNTPTSHHLDTHQVILAHNQQEIKKQRQLDRLAKQRILDQIKMDRLDKRKKLQQPSSSRTSSATTIASNPLAAVEKENQIPQMTASQQHHDSDNMNDTISQTALIQLKLRNGQTVRHSFDANERIQDIFQFVKEQEAGGNHSFGVDDQVLLISAFPRRTFGSEESNISVRDAGFMPNVSLNVSRVSPAESASSIETTNTMPMETNDEDDSMNSDSEEDNDDVSNFIRQPVADPHRSRRNTTHPRFARQNRVTNPNWLLHHLGRRLGDDDNTSNRSSTLDQQDENDERRQHILTTIQQRLSQNTTNDNLNNIYERKLKWNARSLKDLCISQVAAIISSSNKDTLRLLRYLTNLSSELITLLVDKLVETRNLNQLSMSQLARHCYIQQVTLSSYVYATDSLLKELSQSRTLSKIVLRSCDLITDSGIKHLEGLKYLEYLDVSNCKITDKGFQSIAKLPHLVYLNMSKTHITDKGFRWFISHTECQNSLQTLLLSGCQGITSNQTISSLQDFSSLSHLSVSGTKLGEQQLKPGTMKKLYDTLELLDISGTGMTDQDLMRLTSEFGHLLELKLGGCLSITTRGLSCLVGNAKHLEDLQFPNREHDIDGVLARLTDLPLRRLFLNGFLQLTDTGLQHIAKMGQLRQVSLAGVKVTDTGIALLADLQDLEQLYLDQTNVTDEGLGHLKRLTKLNTLSLGRTHITDKALIAMSDLEETLYARQLYTLNLQDCSAVTDRGVKALANLINLTHLNLDRTGVSLQCLHYLKDMEHLRPVRLYGIEKVEPDVMMMEET
ncbi:uncharacterized protein BX664DRAFT_321371 [Halteromyces radiatus]|uniref:uncharacterized protein n=1 Tax=Halteromyces radiatus TaxID=101107 RepID=UPI00221F59D5|nr:uncharacterized protein BX664DRAFT_321371 [Halteromyces radiatus]KAI8099485.1 hypothetical protein BX664DRAFT_321371 [Halteromyces radiatus]